MNRRGRGVDTDSVLEEVWITKIEQNECLVQKIIRFGQFSDVSKWVKVHYPRFGSLRSFQCCNKR